MELDNREKEGSLKDGFNQDYTTRASGRLDEADLHFRHHLEDLKALAYWERKTIKGVIDEALGSYLKGKKSNP